MGRIRPDRGRHLQATGRRPGKVPAVNRENDAPRAAGRGRQNDNVTLRGQWYRLRSRAGDRHGAVDAGRVLLQPEPAAVHVAGGDRGVKFWEV